MTRRPNFPISILGIGTRRRRADSARIRRSTGRFLTDRQGDTIVAKLDAGRLEALAQMCNGRYLTAGADDSNLGQLLETSLPSADDGRRLEGKFDLWADYGYWLALLLIPFALLNFRRGAVALFVFVLMPPPAHASWWSDLWKTPDQQGFPGIAAGRTGTRGVPVRESTVERRRGLSRRRLRRRRSRVLHRHFSGGNLQPRQCARPPGEVRTKRSRHTPQRCAPIRATKTLLSTRRCSRSCATGSKPERNDSNESQRNREQAESGQPREQNSSGNPNQEASQSGEQQANKRPETKQQKSDQDQKQPNDEEKQQTAEREAPRDEQRDALEQWLRRVPDDPSGLLRRKFQFETNERLRSGVPDPRDQERIW
jgi:Ca-activated chloride channel family protein